MRYLAELYDEDDTSEESFEAGSDEEAIAFAKSQFGLQLFELVRVDEPHNVLLWELEPTLYLKFTADGASSIDEVVARLEGLVKELKGMQAEGLDLAAPVDSGHLRFQRSDDELKAIAETG